MNCEYGEGHRAYCAGKSIIDNPYRNDSDRKRGIAWRNGWKDASDNSASRGFDPTHEWVETGVGPVRGYKL